MNDIKATLITDVDLTNPGQFFACCGLLELAQRVWPGAEGWFATDEGTFCIQTSAMDGCTIEHLIEKLMKAGLKGEMLPAERDELTTLESKKRELKKHGKSLTSKDEQRRTSLGKQQREGALGVGPPFNLRVAWWQEESDDVPKTFAGKQEVLRMATAMLSEARRAVQSGRLLQYRCLLRAVGESKKVEPFYFDASRFAHALDVGFSLDVQERTIRATAAPMTELLALIGLQRFRPRQSSESKWSFDYWTWAQPLHAVAAAATACGAVVSRDSRAYRFLLRFRDNQGRYKAFGFSRPHPR